MRKPLGGGRIVSVAQARLRQLALCAFAMTATGARLPEHPLAGCWEFRSDIKAPPYFDPPARVKLVAPQPGARDGGATLLRGAGPRGANALWYYAQRTDSLALQWGISFRVFDVQAALVRDTLRGTGQITTDTGPSGSLIALVGVRVSCD